MTQILQIQNIESPTETLLNQCHRGSNGFTPAQVQRISHFSLMINENEIPLFNLSAGGVEERKKTRALLYEIVGQCFHIAQKGDLWDSSAIDNYITSMEQRLYTMSSRSEVIFNRLIFEREYKAYMADAERMRRDVIVHSGFLPCKYCRSISTMSYFVQTRSGDEATTMITVCSSCGKKWKE